MFTHVIVAALVAAVSPLSAPAPMAVPITLTSPTIPGVVTYTAKLMDGDTGETVGVATYKETRVGGRVEQRLVVSIKGQRSNTVIDVVVNERLVGRMRTNDAGEAKAEFSGPTGTQPSALPRVRKGNVVAAGSAKGAF